MHKDILCKICGSKKHKTGKHIYGAITADFAKTLCAYCGCNIKESAKRCNCFCHKIKGVAEKRQMIAVPAK